MEKVYTYLAYVSRVYCVPVTSVFRHSGWAQIIGRQAVSKSKTMYY